MEAYRSALTTISLISVLTFFGAGILTLILGLDTPWAPWVTGHQTFFPPLTFTIASFFAAFFAVSAGTLLLNALSYISKNPCRLWRLLSVGFLVVYGGYSFTSGTVEAWIMLNILHLLVALPSLVLIPKVTILHGQTPTITPTNSTHQSEIAAVTN